MRVEITMDGEGLLVVITMDGERDGVRVEITMGGKECV